MKKKREEILQFVTCMSLEGVMPNNSRQRKNQSYKYRVLFLSDDKKNKTCKMSGLWPKIYWGKLMAL